MTLVYIFHLLYKMRRVEATFLLVALVGIDAVTVNTEYGVVQGQTIPVDNGIEIVNVNTFNAVPFGKSTEGERRFKVRFHHLKVILLAMAQIECKQKIYDIGKVWHIYDSAGVINPTHSLCFVPVWNVLNGTCKYSLDSVSRWHLQIGHTHSGNPPPPP